MSDPPTGELTKPSIREDGEFPACREEADHLLDTAIDRLADLWLKHSVYKASREQGKPTNREGGE